MSYQAEVFNLMLASPNDVEVEREIAREIILDWNNINSIARKIVLLPLSWEKNAIPSSGNRPQEIINNQVLKNADLLIGIFWTRIGTNTGKAISGTVEEIEEHIELGKPAMLYFSSKPVVPDSIETEQYDAVKKIKKEFQLKNLTFDFSSIEDFRIQFQRHLSMKFNEEKYQIHSINESIEPNVDTTEIRYNLSKEAKTLLIETSIDRAGEIIKAGYKGGFTYQTNGKQLNEDYSPQTKAKWEAAMQELLNLDLISSVGFKGEIFRLTDMGYKVADKLS